MTLSACLITYNEEKHLGDCLNTLDWFDEIVVVDSGSADRTVHIAKEKGCRVIDRKFTHFADQRNFAIRQCTSNWVFVIDPDERISHSLGKEIRKRIQDTHNFNGYRLRRINRIFGHIYWQLTKDWTERLFRRGHAKYVGEIHEKLIIEGEVGELKEILTHSTLETIRDYIQRVRVYLPLELQKKKPGYKSTLFKIFGFSAYRFVNQYIFQMGFMNRWNGFQYCWFAMWYEFIKQSLLWERECE